MSSEQGTTDAERYAREQAFHDERFAHDQRPANRFYAIDGQATERFYHRLAHLEPGAHVLDFGCGADAHASIRVAKAGHRVSAFDLSPVAVDQARRRAGAAGVGDRIDFRVMNAESLDYPDGTFAAVCGTGVLHHLDLRTAYAEIARVLAPSGLALFVEPLGHNAVINFYRDRTPHQRTPDEHPLTVADIEMARTAFERVEPEYHALLTLVTLPLASARGSRHVVRALDKLDRALLSRLPRLGRYAWLVLLSMEGPKAAARP